LPEPGKPSNATAQSRAAAARRANALHADQPLKPADVDLYIDIMKAAVARIENPSPEDRKAIEYLQKMNSGARGVPNADQRALLSRGTELASVDAAIARQRGTEDRYLAIKSRIESMVGPNGSDVDGNAIRISDRALVEPRRDEIESLEIAMHNVLMPAR
jgi:hypothetical protein